MKQEQESPKLMPQQFTRTPGNTQTHRLNYNAVSYTGTSRTATVADVFNALYTRSALGGAATDTTPTAVALIGAMEAPVVGSSFEWYVYNNDNSNDLTIAAGSGVTIAGTAVVGHNTRRKFIGYITAKGPLSTPAVTLQSDGATVQ